MKRFFALFIILSLLFSLSGCAVFKRNVRMDENFNSPGTIEEPDITTKIPQGAPQGTTNTDTIYTNSLRDLDSSLRKNITQMNTIKHDVKSKDYLTLQSEYYAKRAKAYQEALNKANGLKYTGNRLTDHNAIISYYQNGYDTYNSLSSRYKKFKTIDDEKAYRTGEGKNAYDLMPELTDAYTKSLTNFGITY